MNKAITLAIFSLASFAGFSQAITGTVSVGAGYANQKWYSLQNNEVGSQPKDNWDIAFETTGLSSAILVNTQKANVVLYRAPYTASNYGSIDTTGMAAWPVFYNSDSTWSIGAFNRGADPTDPTDMGWGNYDMNTHYVTGDSCFVIKLTPTVYKKIKIVNLAGGVYTFEYADLNGSNSFTQTISKSAYTGKNFAYFNLTSNTAIDREPASVNWDLAFVRYTAFVQMGPIPTPYPVVGIMANKGVQIAQVNNVSNPVAEYDWTSPGYSQNITAIGHDWKTIDINTNTWKVVNDTVYFVKDKSANMWKLHMISFGGSSNGDFVFSKEKISATGIADANGDELAKVAVFPNPSNGSNTTLLFWNGAGLLNVWVSVSDMFGKTIMNENREVAKGLNQYELSTKELSHGIYFVKVHSGSYSSTKKLVITK